MQSMTEVVIVDNIEEKSDSLGLRHYRIQLVGYLKRYMGFVPKLDKAAVKRYAQTV
jgi:hypothetical protein